MKLVIATRNRHKVGEIRAILNGLDVELSSFLDYPDLPDVVEDGETLEQNAIKKAAFVADATGLPALADDTGLEVDALDGAPGVRSARYGGEPPDYARNNERLLRDLADVPPPQRRARFRCVVALALPGEGARTVEGRTEGVILAEPRGGDGFGYDPLFLPDGFDVTYAQMTASEKNAVSHRGKAVRAARRLVEGLLP